ncbi:hypothetical protein GGR26_000507 [Lewinella marina]|uniref:Rod shape-determining protein MreD n=1 Tax=Neolewinella marina TaxID=438751 RepID=A0A2G0CJD0_9BACT|nr:hypothetical protein [Neolewinella marina]NJB84762.1 hypothetical protein [Neolewinella marina]PHL00079.1 hypothetical protein CGL56_03295 [Neolewinella marina]
MLINNVLRFVLLLVAQVFVFNQIAWGWSGKDFLFVFVYPLFVALLPLRTPRPLVILLGFLLGLGVDFFSETLGLHAGALTFTAYCRPLILRLVRPRDGYNIKANPTTEDLGSGWMFRYLSLVLLAHLLAFFLLQTFSVLFLTDIIVKTLLSLPASLLVLGALILIFNPRA